MIYFAELGIAAIAVGAGGIDAVDHGLSPDVSVVAIQPPPSTASALAL
jgi:hypothetical protein